MTALLTIWQGPEIMSDTQTPSNVGTGASPGDHRHAFTHTEEYERALASPHWRNLREEAMDDTGFTCEECKAPNSDSMKLELHHLHYKTLGSETLEDVQILCPSCHRDADRKRAEEQKLAAEVMLKRSRVNGWAKNRWGEDWQKFVNPVFAEAEWQKWIDKRKAQGQPA